MISVLAASDTSTLVNPASISVNTTAQALPSLNVRGVILQCDPASASDILVGTATRQTFVITPVSPLVLYVPNVSQIYVKCSSGTATLNYLVIQ